MEKLQNHTIIKCVGEWNLYDDLAWRDTKSLRRCQFFRHDLNPNKLIAIIEWIEPGSEFHSIVEFYCDPEDDSAKLKFVDDYLKKLDCNTYDENLKDIDAILCQIKGTE